jgi:hypothetical protein
VTRLRRVFARLSPVEDRPAIATLDGALWERVGRLLVARGRLKQRDLDSALAEHRRTRVPLDRILVGRDHVSRSAVASAVLIVQLGDELHDQLRGRLPERPDDHAPWRLTDVPAPPERPFALACLGIDAAVLALATRVAALARSSSTVPLPPAGWMALFAALALGLYWGWRAGTLRTRMRPWADALLLAGATSFAALLVLTIRSLAGKTGVGEEFLPLWAFVTVYGVAGRLGFYLAWQPPRRALPPPGARVRRAVPKEPVPEPAPRALDVVPLRPDLSALLEELQVEIDAVVRERAAFEVAS